MYKPHSAFTTEVRTAMRGGDGSVKLEHIWKQGEEMTEEEVEQLSEVEHNRWNIEQLIANFRPMRLGEERRKVSEMKKERVHPDLKDFSKLKEDAKKYDRAKVRAIPYLYEKWQELRV